MQDHQMSMRPIACGPTAPPTRRRRRTLVTLVLLSVVVIAVLSGTFAVLTSTSQVSSCSPPTQQDMREQEAFLRSHVGDAEGLKWKVADCDDDGDSYLMFDTALTPAAARRAFLADPSCSPYRGRGAGAYDVTCTSSGASVDLYLKATPGATTKGELAL